MLESRSHASLEAAEGGIKMAPRCRAFFLEGAGIDEPLKKRGRISDTVYNIYGLLN